MRPLFTVSLLILLLYVAGICVSIINSDPNNAAPSNFESLFYHCNGSKCVGVQITTVRVVHREDSFSLNAAVSCSNLFRSKTIPFTAYRVTYHSGTSTKYAYNSTPNMKFFGWPNELGSIFFTGTIENCEPSHLHLRIFLNRWRHVCHLHPIDERKMNRVPVSMMYQRCRMSLRCNRNSYSSMFPAHSSHKSRLRD